MGLDFRLTHLHHCLYTGRCVDNLSHRFLKLIGEFIGPKMLFATICWTNHLAKRNAFDPVSNLCIESKKSHLLSLGMDIQKHIFPISYEFSAFFVVHRFKKTKAMDLRLGSRPWMYPSHPMASQELRRDISTAPPIDIRRIWKLREEQNCPVPSGLSVSWLFGMKGGFPFQKTKMMTGWKQTPPFEDEDGLEFPAYHVSFQGCIFFLFGGETKKGSRLFTFLAAGQCGGTTCRCFF